ncbi:MAG: hypothetical protein ACLR6B_12655 [Blautia sp.]
MGTFVTFTHDQIRELASNYGRLEGLWFDAGWSALRTDRISGWEK